MPSIEIADNQHIKTLQTKATALGFKAELVLEGENDDYLAKLTLLS